MEAYVSIGLEIQRIRKEEGISQEELSSLCGVERAQLSRIERGLVPGVTLLTIEKILNSLGRELTTKEKETKEEVSFDTYISDIMKK